MQSSSGFCTRKLYCRWRVFLKSKLLTGKNEVILSFSPNRFDMYLLKDPKWSFEIRNTGCILLYDIPLFERVLRAFRVGRHSRAHRDFYRWDVSFISLSESYRTQFFFQYSPYGFPELRLGGACLNLLPLFSRARISRRFKLSASHGSTPFTSLRRACAPKRTRSGHAATVVSPPPPPPQ